MESDTLIDAHKQNADIAKGDWIKHDGSLKCMLLIKVKGFLLYVYEIKAILWETRHQEHPRIFKIMLDIHMSYDNIPTIRSVLKIDQPTCRHKFTHHNIFDAIRSIASQTNLSLSSKEERRNKKFSIIYFARQVFTSNQEKKT
jgi:hypothetical protein